MEKVEKADIKSMTLKELQDWLGQQGEPAFRGKQLFSWIHEKFVSSFDEMTNLPKTMREKLMGSTIWTVHQPLQVLTSQLDQTKKFLFGLQDGNVIESVYMQYKHGNSVCISTQVGCRMGCKFCASTLEGLVRNLTAAEMLEQIYSVQRITGERISHVVLMGSGEPLDNFYHVLKFLKLISCENGLHISQRNITISTCGLVEQIRQLAAECVQCTLALSLHAPDNETRKELMPIAYRYPLQDVLDACRYYFEKTGRRITFEYSLVAGINDNKQEAVKLAHCVRGLNCHINLIPVNPIKERDYKQSDKIKIRQFKQTLETFGLQVTVRREMGRDIQGACGQLRRSFIKQQAGGN